ncbi:MAG: HAMP domain-containing histidine kinase, partial [Nitrospinota bacterium]|nr:HAMP domain-containing histidine kinase [Nitrospinota bacterium]
LSVNGAFVEPSLDGVEKITSIVDIQADLDPAQMERVFINLVSNAIKHARSRIDINMAAAGPEVEVVFRDDGDGAPKEECPHLFEEYYQAHKGKRGVGLGLPSVKKIIEMHDGQIGIDSDTGAGFTVFMKWPRTLADRKDDDAPKEGAM